MYKVHQDAKYLPIKIDGPDYEFEGKKIPAINASASQDAAGKIHITLVNLDANKEITVSTSLKDLNWTKVTGQILTSGSFSDINTFDHPNKLKPTAFNGAKKDGDKLVVAMPAKSAVVLELN
jgi:alpha-N-arabinofuranosidase